jgi:hypothetical protein
MKGKYMMLFAGILLAAITVQAVTVNFTEAEGYSGDGVIGVWADSLQSQGGNGVIWDETSWGTFAVDSSNGIVNVDGTTGFKKSIYQSGVEATNTTYQVGIQFTFNRSTNQIPARAGVLGVEFTEVASGGNRLSMKFERQPLANSGKYRIAFWENTGSSNTSANGGWSDESDWGFADADDFESDPLWMQLTVTKGADASSWQATCLVSNMLTGFSVSVDPGTFDTSSVYFTDTLYGLMSSEDLESTSGTSNRTIDLFATGEPQFGAPPAVPVSIDTHFTSAEGYAVGALVDNADWGGHNDFTVDPTGTGTVLLPSGSVGFKKALHQTPLTINDIYSVGIEFSFSRTNDTVSASQPNLISVEISEVPTVTSDRLAMQLRRKPSPEADEYFLSMVDQIGTSSFPSSDSFGEAALGFDTNAAFSASDSLWLGFTIQRGASASAWSGTGVISNLTTGTEVQSFTVAFDTTEAFFNDISLYAVVGSVAAEDDTKTSNRVVDRFVATADVADELPEQFSHVEFNAAQGYVSGALYGQMGYWSGYSQTDTVVDSTTNHVLLPSVNSWKQSTYTLPLSATNDVLEVGGVFRFTRTITADTNTAKRIVNFNLSKDLSNYPDNMRISLQRADNNAQFYTVGFNENIGDSFSINADEIAESALGFDGGVTNDLSDDLQFILKVYPGTTTNDWAATVILSNLTAGTEIASVTAPKGWLIVDEGWNFTDEFFGGFSSSDTDADSFTSGRQVESFYVLETTFGSAYEEWAVAQGAGAKEDDSDGDGVNNLGEYALGGDPTDPADRGMLWTELSGDTFRLTHVTLTDPDSGVAYVVEKTDDLVSGTWTNSGITLTTGALDATFDTATNTVSIAGQPQGFLRLKVVEQ